MSDPVARVLNRLDDESPRVASADISSWHDGEFQALRDAGLLREGARAQWADCDGCDEGHRGRVQWLADDPPRAFVSCPENGRVELEPERLRQWTVDLVRLPELLAESLSCAGSVEELVPGRLWLLGRTAVGGRSREMFLARGLAWSDAGVVVGRSRRFLAAVAPVVLVAGTLPDRAVWHGDAPAVLPLSGFVALSERALVADRSYLESALVSGSTAKALAAEESFPTPHGATWDEVRLVVHDHEVEVAVRGRTRRFTFAQAGFEDHRKGGAPDHLWRLLRLFAARGGVVPFDAPDLQRKERCNLKSLVSQLRRRLRALLQLPDDPFRPTRKSRRYQLLCSISTTVDFVLPTPADARWDDLTVHEISAERIRFSFASTERRSGYSGRDDDATLTIEEHAVECDREYDLATLGLTLPDGRPTPEASALRDVLRGRGSVTRPANDKAMLALGARLSRMAQIAPPATPFEFSARESRWTAQFDATSAVHPSAR